MVDSVVDICCILRDYALGVACAGHSNVNVSILQRRVSAQDQLGSEVKRRLEFHLFPSNDAVFLQAILESTQTDAELIGSALPVAIVARKRFENGGSFDLRQQAGPA
jgi:hypothetical protein